MPRLKKRYMISALPAPVPVTPVPCAKFSYDLKAAAEYTGLSVWWLRQALYNGFIRPANQSKPYLILRSELERYIQDGAKKQIAA